MDTKQTSKLISYWLRHNPEDAKLELDAFGRVSIDSLIEALSTRNIQLNKSELIILNKAFDKKRWEIDISTNLIRATHGHSIDVKQIIHSSIPPTFLYHGTGFDNVKSILDKGILSMNRQFVHLSERPNDALKVGLRKGKSVIFEIKTDHQISDDQNFYKSENSIWLSKQISPQQLALTPWYKIEIEREAQSMLTELRKEIRKDDLEITPPILASLEAVWRDQRNDEVVFQSSINKKIYQIHLTWKSSEERIGFPFRRIYNSFEEWLRKSVVVSQQEYFQIKSHDV